MAENITSAKATAKMVRVSARKVRLVLDTIRTIKILRKGSSKDSLRYVPINPNFDEQEFAVKRIINIFEVIGSISKFF